MLSLPRMNIRALKRLFKTCLSCPPFLRRTVSSQRALHLYVKSRLIELTDSIYTRFTRVSCERILLILQGICDGAGAVILASEEAVKTQGLKPLARLVGYTVVGVEPSIMGIGPAPAIKELLKITNKTMNDVELVEVRILASMLH